MGLLRWFRALKLIVRSYDSDRAYDAEERKRLQARIHDLQELIRDRTEVHADIGYRDNSTIIVVGRYNRKDFVQVYSVSEETFLQTVARLKEEQRYARLRTIDAPAAFKAVIERRAEERESFDWRKA